MLTTMSFYGGHRVFGAYEWSQHRWAQTQNRFWAGSPLIGGNANPTFGLGIIAGSQWRKRHAADCALTFGTIGCCTSAPLHCCTWTLLHLIFLVFQIRASRICCPSAWHCCLSRLRGGEAVCVLYRQSCLLFPPPSDKTTRLPVQLTQD